MSTRLALGLYGQAHLRLARTSIPTRAESPFRWAANGRCVPAFASGRLLGVYLHGLFEQPAFVRALLGAAPPRSLDDELDRLADAVGAHIDVDRLMEGLL